MFSDIGDITDPVSRILRHGGKPVFPRGKIDVYGAVCKDSKE
jgi:hypothetical protein